jgi:hypothetical protein
MATAAGVYVDSSHCAAYERAGLPLGMYWVLGAQLALCIAGGDRRTGRARSSPMFTRRYVLRLWSVPYLHCVHPPVSAYVVDLECFAYCFCAHFRSPWRTCSVGPGRLSEAVLLEICHVRNMEHRVESVDYWQV